MKKCVCGCHLFLVKEKKASNGITHVGAYCADCDKWLQWLPAMIEQGTNGLVHAGEVEIPFGKHKGTKLKDLEKQYLQWLAENSNSNLWKQRAVTVLKGLETK